jgi:hypothetical protein
LKTDYFERLSFDEVRKGWSETAAINVCTRIQQGQQYENKSRKTDQTIP